MQTYLQANEEGVCNDHRRELAVLVVCWVCEFEVQKGHECAGVCDEGGAHGQDRTDQAFVDKGVDTAIFDESTTRSAQHPGCTNTKVDVLPSGLRTLDIALAVQRHVAEGIAINELYRPIQQPNEAP